MNKVSNVTKFSTEKVQNRNSTEIYDIEKIRLDFPILSKEVYGKPLIYLDSGASAQKPQQVINAMSEIFESFYSNVHRGVHWTSQQSTEAFELSRETVAEFINATSNNEVIFTRGATESINLVAHSWARKYLKSGDEVIISHMEHHANIVPWQILRQEIGIDLKVVPIDDDGNFLFDEFEKILSPKTKLVSVTHVSNSLGSIVPVKEVIEKAHSVGALVLIDGCQAIQHIKVDVQELNADFYVFSGHKLYGPTGIGVLWGREDLLNSMAPYQTGGEMIASVTFEKTTFKNAPYRFEAGTPAIAEAVGLGVAINYVQAIGLENIAAHEDVLLKYATKKLLEIEELIIIGRALNKTSIISFNLEGIHSHDLGTFLDRAGIALRVGHHCAQPVMDRFKVSATARASFGLYNTKNEVDSLVIALEEIRKFFN